MEGYVMVRTNIVIDEKLAEKCIQATGLKTYRAVVNFALRELLRHKKQANLLKLKGAIKWEGDLTEWRKGRFV